MHLIFNNGEEKFGELIVRQEICNYWDLEMYSNGEKMIKIGEKMKEEELETNN